MNASLPSFIVPHADDSQSPSLESIGFDLAFHVGMRWNELGGTVTARIMDHLGGSRGLHWRVIEWTREFHSHWINLPEAERHDYAFEIELFVTATLDVLIATAGIVASTAAC